MIVIHIYRSIILIWVHYLCLYTCYHHFSFLSSIDLCNHRYHFISRGGDTGRYSKLRYRVITGRHQLRSPRVVVLQAESSIQTGYYSSKERTYNYRNINNFNINNNDNNNNTIDDTNRRTSGRTTIVGKSSFKYQGSKSSNVSSNSSSRSSNSNYFPKGLGAEIKKKIRDVFYSNNSNSDQDSDQDSDIYNKGNTDGNNRNNNIGRVYLNNIKKSSSSSLSSTYYDMKLLDIMTQHRHQLNHHHVITLLYYSAVMRYNDVLSFLSINEIITIFQKSKRLFTSTELAKALYGICRFDDDTIDIKLFIHYLTEQQLKAFKGTLSGQEIAQSLYGLQGISNSNSDDNDVVVESLLDALYNIIVHTIQKTSQDNIDKIVMNAQEISNALYGKIKLVIIIITMIAIIIIIIIIHAWMDG
jgi:hypothetical protein